MIEHARPERQGVFGLLSVGFVAAAFLTLLGGVVHRTASIDVFEATISESETAAAGAAAAGLDVKLASRWALREGSDELMSVGSWAADWALANVDKFQKPDDKDKDKDKDKPEMPGLPGMPGMPGMPGGMPPGHGEDDGHGH